jgi:gas vesicle protein
MKVTKEMFNEIQRLAKEIHTASYRVMKKWESEDGLNLDKGQDAVMVLIKEYMNVQDPSIGQMKECLSGLQMILK